MKRLKIILLFSLLISIIYISYVVINKTNTSIYHNESEITGKILSYKINGNQLQLKIKAKEKLIIFYKLNTKEEKEYYKKNLKIGDIYTFSGSLKTPSDNTNFNLFSYKNYLLSNKIYYTFEASKIVFIKENKNIFYKIKNNIYNSIKNKESYKYLLIFLLGDTTEMDSKIITKYRTCGISHLIAVSGMHVTLFAGILLSILKCIKNDFIKNIIVIAILWIYAFLIGFTPSITRAVSSFSILSLLKLLNIKANSLYILIFIGIMFLIYNPYLIYNTGFLFSYVISFFIILSQKEIGKYKNYFVKTFVISLISFVASIPIIGVTFYETNLLSPIINILFVPLISYIIFPLSMITFIFSFLEPIYMILIYLLETLVNICNNLLVVNITIPYMNIYLFIIYYIIFIISVKYKKKYIFLIIIILMIHINKKIFQRYPVITAIDVGQGDSILLELPHNKGNILIDTGGKISYMVEEWKQKESKSLTENILSPYFKSIGINKLDYLIITHGDYDHMGEAINLVNNFKVKKVILNCGEFNDLEQGLIEVLDKEEIPYYSCIKKLNIDDNKLYFLNNKDYGNENDNSNVIYTELNNYKFLFMGDAGVEVEEDLIEKYNLKDIDVLKVGHHGSKTSSGEYFIDSIAPKYSVISVGKNNRYGHPNNNVLDNLEDSKIYRTDLDGNIIFRIKNNKLKIETCTS